MKRVIIFQRILPHYREPLFRQLHSRLASKGIELHLQYGQARPGSVPQSINFDAGWAEFKTNIYIGTTPKAPVFQAIPWKVLREADLVITEQASRLVNNYLLITGKWLGYKLAFWGHGRNFQSNHNFSISETIKRYFNKFTDHWFAYTQASVDVLERQGVSLGEITCLQNSIDTAELKSKFVSLEQEKIEHLRARLGFGDGKVGIFCGGMDERKRLPFLFSALLQIRQELPEFNMLFVGDGPESESVMRFCAEHSWAKAVGKITSAERVAYFALSDAVLMPGALGLVVLDSLITQTPVVTTRIKTHNPEIAYLLSGVNSVFSDDSVEDYKNQVVALFQDQKFLKKLAQQCAEDASLYSIENMVDNFATGIERVLSN